MQRLASNESCSTANLVKGFNDDAEKKSLTAFAELLNKYDIGFAAIEGLKAPQERDE